MELDSIRKAIANAERTRHHPEGPSAAVAGVFLPDPLRLLFIRRAEHEGDPWSGQMAFPGGRHDEGDRDLLHTALRETREELGLDLSRAEHLGPMADINASRRRFNLIIRPHFFILDDVPPLTPNHEVSEIHWGEVPPMLRGERRAVQPWEVDGRQIDFPGFEVGGRIVWGLTYMMLQQLFGAVKTHTQSLSP